MGARVPCGVRQRLLQNRYDLVGQRRRHPEVEQALHPQRRGEPQQARGPLDCSHHPGPQAALGLVTLPGAQPEDGGPDGLHGVVQVVDGPQHPLRGLRVFDEADRALQCHPGREQPLDRQVVQVTSDPVTLLKQGDLLGVPAPLSQLHRHRCLPREPHQRRGLRRLEDRPARRPGQHQHPAHAACHSANRHRHGRPQALPARRTCGDPRILLHIGAGDQPTGLDRGTHERALQR